MKNKAVIFVILILFTLLLLEIPKQYYLVQDQKLLMEQGSEQHEILHTSTTIDFSFKLNSFFNSSASLPTSGIGYTKELNEDETLIVLENISEELQLLIDKRSELFLSTIEQPSTQSRCFTAQVFQRQEETQYIWEVGFLELLTQKNQLPFARIIYDTDTYKIIMLIWEIPKEETQFITDSYVRDLNSAANYYSDISGEIYIQDNINSGIIYPIPIPYEFTETSTLYPDLVALAEYFWGEKYSSDLIQEGYIQK